MLSCEVVTIYYLYFRIIKYRYKMLPPDVAQYKDFVGIAALIVTVIQFLSGSVICAKYIRTRTTADTSSLSFVCGFLSCFLWLKYGLLKDDHLVFFVNLIGCSLFFCYIAIYYKFTTKKALVLVHFSFVCGFLTIFHIYISQETNILNAIQKTGLLSCIVTLIFIASPLALLMHVIKVKSTDSLPFPIILTSLFVCSLWFIYGYLIGDKFMQVPNAIGAMLSMFQLSLFLYYPSPSGAQQIPYIKMRQTV